MRRCALIVIATSAVFGAHAAGASPRTVSLPWPPVVLPRQPPLAPSTSGALLNVRFLGNLDNRERVVVGLRENGLPHSIRVLQTIVVKRLGDYVFTVPAPVTSVLPGPGTQSPPGQRVNQILWEGFSPGHRVLASWADLRVPESEPSLPVRVSLVTTVGGSPLAAGEKRSGDLRVSLIVSNVTGTTAKSFTADPEPASLSLVLARIRDAIRRGVFAEGVNVNLRSAQRATRVRVAVPLRIDGTLRFAPGTTEIGGRRNGVTHVAGLLDGTQRSNLRLELKGRAIDAAPPVLELRIRTAPVQDRVTAAQSPRIRLARTIDVELGYARKRQYDMFLASPDVTGPSSTTYVYRTAAVPRTVPLAAAGAGGSNLVLWLVIGFGLVLGLPAAAVAWAHS